MSSKFTVDDRVWRKITSAVAKAGAAEVRVGVIGSDAEQQHPDSGLTVAEIALIHEYGSDAAGVPARSFIGRTFDKRSRLITSMIAQAASNVIHHQSSMVPELEKMGRRLAAEIRQTILSGVSPELAQATIDKKGHDHPLIDSGVLVDAISYKVVLGHDKAIDDYYDSIEIYEPLGGE